MHLQTKGRHRSKELHAKQPSRQQLRGKVVGELPPVPQRCCAIIAVNTYDFCFNLPHNRCIKHVFSPPPPRHKAMCFYSPRHAPAFWPSRTTSCRPSVSWQPSWFLSTVSGCTTSSCAKTERAKRQTLPPEEGHAEDAKPTLALNSLTLWTAKNLHREPSWNHSSLPPAGICKQCRLPGKHLGSTARPDYLARQASEW